MKIDIPWEIGDEITIDGRQETIKGLHCFIDQYGEVTNVSAYIGGEKRYVMLHRTTKKRVSGKHGCKQQTKRSKV